MMKRWRSLMVILGAITVTGVGCTRGDGTAADTAPEVEERTFAVKLEPTPLRVGFLTAELADLRVVERVREGSGEVVDPPKLHGQLKLKNTSADRSARLVGGTVEYIGADGNEITPASGRGDTTFSFYSYSERIDPGKDMSQGIEVPFPAAAVNGAGLSELRLELTYVPTPFRTGAATASASLVAQRP